MKTPFFVFLLLIIFSSCEQRIIYVDKALGNDIVNSGNETHPFATIHRALQNYTNTENTTTIVMILEGNSPFKTHI